MLCPYNQPAEVWWLGQRVWTSWALLLDLELIQKVLLLQRKPSHTPLHFSALAAGDLSPVVKPAIAELQLLVCFGTMPGNIVYESEYCCARYCRNTEQNRETWVHLTCKRLGWFHLAMKTQHWLL